MEWVIMAMLLAGWVGSVYLCIQKRWKIGLPGMIGFALIAYYDLVFAMGRQYYSVNSMWDFWLMQASSKNIWAIVLLALNVGMCAVLVFVGRAVARCIRK